MADKRASWEQLPNESDAAYAWFLVYRNLGIARSLDAAYRRANPLPNGATKRDKTRRAAKSGANRFARDTRRANGQWWKNFSEHSWHERATAWDIETLNEIGKAVVVKYVNALDMALGKVLRVLESEKTQPRGWAQVMESLTILGNFIPQENVSAVRQDSADAPRPTTKADAADIH